MDEPMVISICSLTWDRFEIVNKVYGENIENCGIPRENLELLVADNGSTNEHVIAHIAKFKPAYHRLNKANEGVGRALNQLMVRATGDMICLMGSDIQLQPGWLDELIKYQDAVPNAGIVGIKCTAEIPPLQTKQDKYGRPCHAHYLTPQCDKVFGTMLFSRHVLETVGGFHEGFHPYGFEDSDFNNRITKAGFTSLYVPAACWQSVHVGGDCGETSEYRKMKDQSLARNLSLFGERIKTPPPIFEPLPPKRLPCEVYDAIPEVDLSTVDIEEIRRTPIG